MGLGQKKSLSHPETTVHQSNSLKAPNKDMNTTQNQEVKLTTYPLGWSKE